MILYGIIGATIQDRMRLYKFCSVPYQQLSKREAEFCQHTKHNNSMRETRQDRLVIVRYQMQRQMLGHSCLGLGPPLLVRLIFDSGGLSQRHPIKIILELPYVFFRNHSFLHSQGVDKPRDPRSPPISNIVEQFLHRDSAQGHYEADQCAAYARFRAHKQQGIHNGDCCVLCWQVHSTSTNTHKPNAS